MFWLSTAIFIWYLGTYVLLPIPAVRPALSGRQTREAARAINVFLSAARNVAAGTGRQGPPGAAAQHVFGDPARRPPSNLCSKRNTPPNVLSAHPIDAQPYFCAEATEAHTSCVNWLLAAQKLGEMHSSRVCVRCGAVVPAADAWATQISHDKLTGVAIDPDLVTSCSPTTRSAGSTPAA